MSVRIVFAASEVFPLAKTGGLADVAASLPNALVDRGADVRIALPAYRGWASQVAPAQALATFTAAGHAFKLWQAHHPALLAPLWLFDCPNLFDRPGDLYQDATHQSWPDNTLRFGAFADAVAQATARPDLTGFDADLLHCNDWHTGLAPAWLRERDARVASVFTIHNLAYQGNSSHELLNRLGLPSSWWHMEGVEFHGELSQLKAGIVFADAVTAVSPTYAGEIQQPEYGAGLDGVLRSRAYKLRGIANGIDDRVWNPATDPCIARRYDVRTRSQAKRSNRTDLQQRLGLTVESDSAVIGVVSRLVHQKGLDLIVEALPRLLALPIQLAVLGTGEPAFADALKGASRASGGRVGLHLGHDEPLAHRIIAGADMLLMPSRYEPCGLTQMYAQRYGTIPVVRRTGGLADTVIDASEATLSDHTATGVHFCESSVDGLLHGVSRALELRASPQRWSAMQVAGMGTDFSWARASNEYLALYHQTLGARR